MQITSDVIKKQWNKWCHMPRIKDSFYLHCKLRCITDEKLKTEMLRPYNPNDNWFANFEGVALPQNLDKHYYDDDKKQQLKFQIIRLCYIKGLNFSIDANVASQNINKMFIKGEDIFFSLNLGAQQDYHSDSDIEILESSDKHQKDNVEWLMSKGYRVTQSQSKQLVNPLKLNAKGLLLSVNKHTIATDKINRFRLYILSAMCGMYSSENECNSIKCLMKTYARQMKYYKHYYEEEGVCDLQDSFDRIDDEVMNILNKLNMSKSSAKSKKKRKIPSFKFDENELIEIDDSSEREKVKTTKQSLDKLFRLVPNALDVINQQLKTGSSMLNTQQQSYESRSQHYNHWMKSDSYSKLVLHSSNSIGIHITTSDLLKHSQDFIVISIDKIWYLLRAISGKPHIINYKHHKAIINRMLQNKSGMTPASFIGNYTTEVVLDTQFPVIISLNTVTKFNIKQIYIVVTTIIELCHIYDDILFKLIKFLITISSNIYDKFSKLQMAQQDEEIDGQKGRVCLGKYIDFETVKEWIMEFIKYPAPNGYRQFVWISKLSWFKNGTKSIDMVWKTINARLAYVISKVSIDDDFLHHFLTFSYGKGMVLLHEINHVNVNNFFLTKMDWYAVGKPLSSQGALNHVSNASRYNFINDNRPNAKLKFNKNINQIINDIHLFGDFKYDAESKLHIIHEAKSEADIFQTNNRTLIYPYFPPTVKMTKELLQQMEYEYLWYNEEFIPGWKRIVEHHQQDAPKPDAKQKKHKKHKKRKKDQKKPKPSKRILLSKEPNFRIKTRIFRSAQSANK